MVRSTKWAWVNWDKAMLNVPAEVRKGRVGKRVALNVPLSALALRLLREQQKITGRRDRVFVGDGISLGQVSSQVKAATGLTDLSLHDLRRSTASLDFHGAVLR